MLGGLRISVLQYSLCWRDCLGETHNHLRGSLKLLQITAAAIDGSATALSLFVSLQRSGALHLLIVTWMLSDLSARARGLLASTLALWVTFNILPLMVILVRYYLGGTHNQDLVREGLDGKNMRSVQTKSLLAQERDKLLEVL